MNFTTDYKKFNYDEKLQFAWLKYSNQAIISLGPFFWVQRAADDHDIAKRNKCYTKLIFLQLFTARKLLL